MVMPTTVRPWRTSMAATVELSTPPLMATAMGNSVLTFGITVTYSGTTTPLRSWLRLRDRTSETVNSGMHRDPAQVRHAGADGFDERVHLPGRIAAPQGEAHTGARAVIAQADGLQHVRRRDRARPAGRPGGDREAAQVERDHHGFAIDAFEVKIAGVGHAIPARAVDARAGNAFEHGVLQAVAQHGEAFGVLGHAAPGEFRGRAEGRDSRDVLRAGPAVALVMAAVGDGREAGSLAGVERSHALGRIQPVAAHAAEDYPRRGHVHRRLAQRLHAIHVQRRAGLVRDLRDLGDGLQRAEFVIGVHDTDQHGLWAHGAPDVFRANDAARPDPQAGDVHAFDAQLLGGREHRRVLDGAGDDVL